MESAREYGCVGGIRLRVPESMNVSSDFRSWESLQTWNKIFLLVCVNM